MTKKLKISFILLFFLIFAKAKFVLCADESLDKTSQLDAKVESATAGALSEFKTTSELIELLKQRAMLKVKKKRREQLLKFSISASANSGYESNVNNDSSNKGDTFHNEFVMLNWAPTLNKRLGLNVTGFSYNQAYSDFTDSNYLYSSVFGGVRLYPFEDGKLRLEPGAGYATLWYPFSADSSYNEVKFYLNSKNFLTRQWNLDINSTASFKKYDSRKARNPSGVTQDFNREDATYSVDTTATYYVGRYSVALKGAIGKNSSNDLLQDLNDYYYGKSELTIDGTFLEGSRLYTAFIMSFERKNYKERLAVDSAESDNRYNYRFTVYYTLNKNYMLNYKFDYWSLDSNSPISEYKNLVNQVGVLVKF